MAKGRRESDGFERRLRAALEHMTRDEAAAAVARAQAEVEVLIANGLEQEREICRLEAALAAAEARLQRERSSGPESNSAAERRSEVAWFSRMLHELRERPPVDADRLWEYQLDDVLRGMFPADDDATLETRKAAVRKLRAADLARVEADPFQDGAKTKDLTPRPEGKVSLDERTARLGFVRIGPDHPLMVETLKVRRDPRR